MTNPTPMPAHHDLHAPWSEDMATWYTENYGEHSANYKTIEYAELIRTDKLLDIGCGSGSAVRAAARMITEGEVIGLDLSPAMIRIAQEQSQSQASKQISFVVGEAVDLPIESQSKTVVTAINSFHHWPDPMKGLGEVSRILRPGGRLLVCEDLLSEEEQQTRNSFDESKVRALLTKAGFRQSETITLNNPDGSIFIIKARV